MRLSLLAVIALALPLRADDAWTLTTSDFVQQAIKLQSFAETGVRFTAGADEKTLPVDQFLSLGRDARSPASAGRYTLFLVTGDRIGGEPGVIADDVVNWVSPSLGELKLPIGKVRAISRDPNPPALDEDRKEDQVVLSNKDVVRGVVAGLADGKIAVQVNGDASSISFASAVALYFASPAKPLPSNVRAFRVQFADGSILTTPSLKAEAGNLQIKLADDAPRSVDLGGVSSIEQVNGPVVWLSALKPTVNEQVSFVSETPLPARMDRNVFGKPMRFGVQTFDRGIGVHANSKLVFPLDGSYATFRTRYAIDTTRDAGIANVSVRVFLDDKVVHEDKTVRANRMSSVLQIPLKGAKTLTLEVIANETIDAQDRLNWIESALVRKADSK